jgi:uncharacterized membrane protein YgdD (TMEM256/DUF423 family)
MFRLWLILAALAGLSGVLLAAVMAHGWDLEPGQFRVVDSAILMQFVHALALLATALWAERRGGLLPHLAAGGFALGILGFCGALWTLVFAGRSLGPLAPTGGMLLMAGWLLLGLSALLPVRGRRP